MPDGETGDLYRSRLEAKFKFRHQGARNMRFDLILYRHMRAPTGLILRDKERCKAIGYFGTNSVQLIAPNTERHTTPQRHKTNKRRLRCDILRDLPDMGRQFVLNRHRQVMKQRQMRAQHIAIRRIVPPPKPIKIGKISITHQRGHDQRNRPPGRAGRLDQIST